MKINRSYFCTIPKKLPVATCESVELRFKNHKSIIHIDPRYHTATEEDILRALIYDSSLVTFIPDHCITDNITLAIKVL